MKTAQSHKHYFDSEVISRNIITDWVQGIRNLLGLKLKAYNNSIKETTEEMMERMPEMEWFRIDVEEFSDGGFMIAIYGEKK